MTAILDQSARGNLQEILENSGKRQGAEGGRLVGGICVMDVLFGRAGRNLVFFGVFGEKFISPFLLVVYVEFGHFNIC